MKSILILALVTLIAPATSYAEATMRIVGSSTVFPFSSAVAEQVGKRTGSRTPVVESTGSGGGLKLFCSGVGKSTPDITNSSRRIKQSEIDKCNANGVGPIVEVKVGYDGIVIANTRKAGRFELTTQQIFQALAKDVPLHGKLVPNPYAKWNEIDPSLPDARIEVMGPPPTSGTRDAFVELAMEGGARQFPSLAAMKKQDKKKFKAVAHGLREDGAYIQAGENDNLIVQKLQANPNALGIFGFSFLDQNRDRVQGSLVNGEEPTLDSIADGDYAISRSLFFYVKKAHVERVPAIEGYVSEFLSDRASGEDGYLTDRGLIPLPDADRKLVRDASLSLTPLAGL
jgi:phosphate transport system substrate-binding protein